MKNVNKFGIILFVAVATLFSSCSKDSGSGGGSAGLGTLKATAGGSSFTSISQGTFALLASNGAYQNLSITGSTAAGKSIQLTILNQNISAGTYVIDDSNSDVFATGIYSELNQSNPQNSLVYSAPFDGGGNVGSITISSIDATNVKGTFSFTGKDDTNSTTKVVTNGSFNVNITSN